jgi:hypothetical protein
MPILYNKSYQVIFSYLVQLNFFQEHDEQYVVLHLVQ